jgi:hypothetical protein
MLIKLTLKRTIKNCEFIGQATVAKLVEHLT